MEGLNSNLPDHLPLAVRQQILCAKRLSRALEQRIKVTGVIEGMETTIEWIPPDEETYLAIYQLSFDLSQNPPFWSYGNLGYDTSEYFCDDSLNVQAIQLNPTNGDPQVIEKFLIPEDITEAVVEAINNILSQNNL